MPRSWREPTSRARHVALTSEGPGQRPLGDFLDDHREEAPPVSRSPGGIDWADRGFLNSWLAMIRLGVESSGHSQLGGLLW